MSDLLELDGGDIRDWDCEMDSGPWKDLGAGQALKARPRSQGRGQGWEGQHRGLCQGSQPAFTGDPQAILGETAQTGGQRAGGGVGSQTLDDGQFPAALAGMVPHRRRHPGRKS